MKQKKTYSKDSINKKQENWLAKHTYRKIANPIAVYLAKINATSVQITILLDHVDGAVARYTNNQTMVGSWFDKFSNKLYRFLFVLGVTLGVYKTTGDPFYLILGNISGFLWIFALYISETKRIFFKFKDDITLFKESGNRQIFPFTLIVSNIFGILALSNNPAAALWFVAIISLNAFQQIYSAHKYWSKEKY